MQYTICQNSGMRSLKAMLQELLRYYDSASDIELVNGREDYILQAIESLQDAVSREEKFDWGEYIQEARAGAAEAYHDANSER